MKKLFLTTAIVSVFSALLTAQASVAPSASPAVARPGAEPILEHRAGGSAPAHAVSAKNAARSKKLRESVSGLKAEGSSLKGDEALAFALHIGAAEIWLDVLDKLESDFPGKKTKKVIKNELEKARNVLLNFKAQSAAFDNAAYDKVAAALKVQEAKLEKVHPEDKPVVEGMFKYAHLYLGFVDKNKDKPALVSTYLNIIDGYIAKVSKFILKSESKPRAATPHAVTSAPTVSDLKTAPAASAIIPSPSVVDASKAAAPTA
jgi:hypothetical protein